MKRPFLIAFIFFCCGLQSKRFSILDHQPQSIIDGDYYWLFMILCDVVAGLLVTFGISNYFNLINFDKKN